MLMNTLCATARLMALWLFCSSLQAAESIRVGILHSLSGTMGISEQVLKETALMTIEQINRTGGVLGRRLEPVVMDPASNWTLFAEQARDMLVKERVAVIFGCWTSVSRKAVLPVLRELNGLLFYPVQYEGEELERNVFYTGAAPNQQAIPAIEYLMSRDAGAARRFVLLGTDYIYPRTTNRIVRAFLKSQGVAAYDIMERYTPFGHEDYQAIIEDIRLFAAEGKKTAVISTINGDSNLHFYRALAAAKLSAADMPVMAFSVGEEELRSLDRTLLAGHLATWNYFMSLKGPDNQRFVARYRAWAMERQLPDAAHAVTNDPMEATYIGIHLWKQAVEKARTPQVDAVIAAMAGQQFQAPSGFRVRMDEKNHHLHKPVFIGEIQANGQFKLVWKISSPLKAAPWSYYLPGNEQRKDEPEGQGFQTPLVDPR